MEFLTALALNIPLLNNILLFGFFFTFAFVFWRESKNPNSLVNWTDLLMDDKKGKVSLTKLGQFWGIAISSWVTIYMAQKLSADQIATMFPWIFGTWLTFLVASHSIKAYTATKEKLVPKEEEETK